MTSSAAISLPPERVLLLAWMMVREKEAQKKKIFKGNDKENTPSFSSHFLLFCTAFAAFTDLSSFNVIRLMDTWVCCTFPATYSSLALFPFSCISHGFFHSISHLFFHCPNYALQRIICCTLLPSLSAFALRLSIFHDAFHFLMSHSFFLIPN